MTLTSPWIAFFDPAKVDQISPGSNSPFSSAWLNRIGTGDYSGLVATLTGFDTFLTTGWQGSGTAADPRLGKARVHWLSLLSFAYAAGLGRLFLQDR